MAEMYRQCGGLYTCQAVHALLRLLRSLEPLTQPCHCQPLFQACGSAMELWSTSEAVMSLIRGLQLTCDAVCRYGHALIGSPHARV